LGLVLLHDYEDAQRRYAAMAPSFPTPDFQITYDVDRINYLTAFAATSIVTVVLAVVLFSLAHFVEWVVRLRR
jgi:hypothetical protein